MAKPWQWLLLGVVISLLLALSIRGCYNEYKLRQEKEDLNALLKQSNTDSNKAISQITTLKKAKQELEKSLRSQIEKSKELLQEVATLRAELKSHGSGKAVVRWKTKTVVKEKVKTVYIKGSDGQQHEVTSIPIEYQDFRLSLKGDALSGQIEYSLHQRFEGQIVRTINKAGHSTLYLNLFEIDDKDNIVSHMQINKIKYLEVDKRANHFAFDLKLDISLAGGIDIATVRPVLLGDIGLSFFSYGKDKNDNIIRLLRVSAGVSTDMGISIGLSPVTFNISRYLPLLNDLYMGPMLYYSILDNGYGVLLGIGSTL